jgi:hypothetical protein
MFYEYFDLLIEFWENLEGIIMEIDGCFFLNEFRRNYTFLYTLFGSFCFD